FYRICGLPSPMTGKVQVFRNGVSSGEVAATIPSGVLGLRSFSIADVRVATLRTDSSPTGRTVYRGGARLTGVVRNQQRQPVAGGRVSVAGSGVATLTNPRGEFTLDSLPAGTQSLQIRKLGYGMTEQAVELKDDASVAVAVTMN